MVKIKKITETEYEVDELTVYQDSSGRWHGHPDMTPRQISAFQKHLKTVENEKAGTKS